MWERLGLIVAVFCLVLLGIVWWQERRLRFYRTLAALDEALGRLNDPAEFEPDFLRLLASHAEAEAALLYAPAPGPISLRLKAAHGLDQSALIAAASDPWLRHLVAEMAESREKEIARSLKNRQGFLTRYEAVLAIRFPGNKGKPSGVAFFFRRRKPFTRERIRVLRAVAPRAATALIGAQAYREQTAVTEENARLYVSLSRLRRLSTVDDLTGLSNRRYLIQRLKEEMKKSWRFGQPFSVVLVETLFFLPAEGEEKISEGDWTELLAEAAGLLKGAVRDYDVIGRYSRENFFLLLPHTESGGALALAERLRTLLEDHVFAGGIRARAFLGVCTLQPSSWQAFPAERLRDRNLVDRFLEEILLGVGEALRRAKTEDSRTALLTLNSLPRV
ncbi:MAG: GGDEF domain-containing protein [Firmicutes bacterium]|nr:GGDEF domain-containing protein [Bacillota bacterium]